MINPAYQDEEVIKTIRQTFKKTGMVHLDNFMDEKSYILLKEKSKKLKFTYKKIPDSFSYSVSSQKNFFESFDFKNYLKRVSDKNIRLTATTIKRFSHRDYTIIKDGQKTSELLFVFFLVDRWEIRWGGNKVMTTKDESYVFPPRANSLLIIKKTPYTKEFLQYINHKAERNHMILIEGSIKD